MNIESLESRIAPATLVNPTTVTFTDENFDLVTVKVSKGSFQLTDANGGEPGDNFTFTDLGLGRLHLTLLDMHNSGPFSKANVTITAARTGLGGDGHVNVDFIDASGTDLGNVRLTGDLGHIEAGDPNLTTTGLGKLTVASMGRFVPNASTLIQGALGSLVISGDLNTASIDVTGGVGTPALGKIGSVRIGGTMRGGTVGGSGSIEATGDIGTVTIGGDLRGGSGNLSGQLHAVGKIGNVTIGGSVVGSDAGPKTGQILGQTGIGLVKIRGDLKAGNGLDSGSIHSGGKLGGLSIGGSLIGGSAADPFEFRQVSSDAEIGPVKIVGDLRGAAGNGSAAISAMGKIASVKIGGSLIGGAGFSSASISTHKGLGAVIIGGSVLGGGDSAGQVVAFVSADIASLTIGGSVVGGSGFSSGVVGSFQGTLGPTKIGGDVRGGSQMATGQIFGGDEKMPSLTIGGSVIGTNFSETGKISANIAGTIKIGGNLVGGSISGSENTDRSGYIQAIRIGSVFIGGSIIAGTDTSIGDATLNASIRASVDIGSITVKGSIVGNVNVQPLISAAGKGFSIPNVIAIKRFTVGGSVDHALIRAGYNTNGGGDAINPDALIGKVSVGGDWTASSLVAGVDPVDAFFGNGNDVAISETGEPDAIFSKIASIAIKGQVSGTTAGGDFFGFVAQQIGSFKIGTAALPLKAGHGNDTTGFFIGLTGDVAVREIL